MATELEKWASIERQFITDEVKWLKAGGKFTSPSGDDITASKIEELEARLEHVNKALNGQAFVVDSQP